MTEDTIQALGSPKSAINYLAAGLIESSGKKLQEISIIALKMSLTMKPNTSKKRKNHQNTRNYDTTQSVEQ